MTKQPSREGKTTVQAWVTTDSAFVLQELILKLGRDRGAKVTLQDAVLDALNDYAKKHGINQPIA